MVDLKSDSTGSFPPAAEAALLKGNKIDAIKIVRRERGVDLKDAKDIVERYVAGHPELQARAGSAQAEATWGLLSWLLALIAIGALVYFFVNR
ncbi:MAG: hypothetical protein FJW26_18115 [Acidimicrobiia bacterium]|nr:hypothetical protein [Acidimicrobiia bacterium]